MAIDFAQVLGLVFTDPELGATYGVIRPTNDPTNHPGTRRGYLVFAEDESGNAFLLAEDGQVAFWDHETDEISTLAATWPEFVAGCAKPPQVELDPQQVEAVWIDPVFAKAMGIQVPPDGWKKKKRE